MIANSLIVTVAVLLALGFWLMGELKFLVPYRSILYHQYDKGYQQNNERHEHPAAIVFVSRTSLPCFRLP